MTVNLQFSEEVRKAQRSGTPLVALESTLISHGLPHPENIEVAGDAEAAVRSAGAVPATTAVVDGMPHVGLEADVMARLATASGVEKLSRRNLPAAMSGGAHAPVLGATTVSATMILANLAGIGLFATGGIGGVHREVGETGDVSADLDAIASFSLVTVCAGAKAFLDLGRTLEHLETAGVPVLGWRHDELPAFYTRSSGHPVPHRVESAAEVAAVLAGRTRPERGVLLTVPIPEADELDPGTIDAALRDALADAATQGVRGAAVTPFVLGRIGAATGGDSVPANLALAENNAAVAAEVAVAIRAARR